MHHVLVIHLDDEPGSLERVVSVCRKRAFNIHSLTVSPGAEADASRLTLVVDAEEAGAQRVQVSLEKLLNVRRVERLAERGSVLRDLALVRVATDAGARPAVLQLAQVFRAQVVDLAEDSLVLECTGSLEKLDRFVSVLRPFGLLDLGRSGAVAMARGESGALPMPFEPFGGLAV